MGTGAFTRNYVRGRPRTMDDEPEQPLHQAEEPERTSRERATAQKQKQRATASSQESKEGSRQSEKEAFLRRGSGPLFLLLRCCTLTRGLLRFIVQCIRILARGVHVVYTYVPSCTCTCTHNHTFYAIIIVDHMHTLKHVSPTNCTITYRRR